MHWRAQFKSQNTRFSNCAWLWSTNKITNGLPNNECFCNYRWRIIIRGERTNECFTFPLAIWWKSISLNSLKINRSKDLTCTKKLKSYYSFCSRCLASWGFARHIYEFRCVYFWTRLRSSEQNFNTSCGRTSGTDWFCTRMRSSWLISQSIINSFPLF